MLKWYVFLLFLITGPAYSQESAQILFTEEYDSLPPVRFIDRYENVFMNKVPTRNIFKFGISQYQQSTPFAL